ncbi:MAG TPA: TIGR00725 family protein [Solirubrobacteraceae bacterium]|jgi:hypothetical protein
MAYVAVVGPDAGPRAFEDLLGQAREVGRLLAAAGAIVVCGGLGGAMEAVSEGVAEAGGSSVGLLPGRDRTDANASLSIALPTGLGEGRNWLVVCASDVVIAVGGGYGTLSEIALALRSGRDVVGLGTWAIANDNALMHVADSAADAVAQALRLADS